MSKVAINKELFDALANNDLAGVNRLLKAGTDLNSVDSVSVGLIRNVFFDYILYIF